MPTARHSARDICLRILLIVIALLLPAQVSAQLPRAATLIGSFSAAPSPAPFEASFTLTAALAPAGGPAPTGTVSFSLDSVVLGSSSVAANAATYTVPAYAIGSPTPPIFPGDHTITAKYSGDAIYPSATSTEILTVLRGPTVTTLTPTTPIPTPYGDPVDGTFVVNVLDPFYPATGTYTVLDNGAAVPECTGLTLPTPCPYGDPEPLDAGPHALSVAYNGDPINAPSASEPIGFTVTPDDVTSATLTSSLNPSPLGSAVTFTATLTGNAVTPSGSVQFTDSGILLGTAPLNGSGVATFTTSALTQGTHPITAVFLATPNFSAATSNVVQQQIVPVVLPGSGFTLAVSPAPVTVLVGGIATLRVTVTDLGSFSQPVQLSCSGLPEQAACTFVQALIPGGGGSTTLLLATASPHDCSSTTPYFPVTTSKLPRPTLPMAAFFLAGAAFLRKRSRRLKVFRTLLAVTCLGGLTQLSACGHCTNFGTRPGSYTFTVTGVAQQGTALTQSQKITLKVTLQ